MSTKRSSFLNRITLGGALFLLGTLISAWPERARLAAPRPLPATPAPPVPVEA